MEKCLNGEKECAENSLTFWEFRFIGKTKIGVRTQNFRHFVPQFLEFRRFAPQFLGRMPLRFITLFSLLYIAVSSKKERHSSRWGSHPIYFSFCVW